MKGESTQTVRDIRTEDGRLVVEIESTVVVTGDSGRMHDRGKIMPTTVVSEFDGSSGKFLKRHLKSSATGLTGGGERFQLRVEGTSQLLPSSEPSSWRPLAPALELDLGAGRKLWFVSHSGWIDKNKDGFPGMDEFKEVTTRFSEKEKYCVVVFIQGLKDRRLSFELVDARGAKLTSGAIPLKNDNMWALREIVNKTGSGSGSGLSPGMYFLEWSLDDRYLTFIPIQVLGGEHAKPAAIGERPDKPKNSGE